MTRPRRSMERWLGPVLDTSELDRVKLLTSELVTNAVVHGTGQINLHARLDEDRVLVEVVDEVRDSSARSAGVTQDRA